MKALTLDNNKSTFLIGLLTGILAVSFFVSLMIGSIELSILVAFKELLSKSLSQSAIVLWEVRIPRTLIGCLVGGTLGLAGAGMQGLLRNPLASPGVLGVSGGASLGAVLAFYTGFAATFPLALPIGGMLGALIAVIFLYLFVGTDGSIQTLILAGVAINSLAIAGTYLVLNLSPDPHAHLEIIFWQMGSIANRSFDHVFLAFPLMFIGWVMIFSQGRALTALSLGEETAESLGFHMNWVRTQIVIGTALAVGSAVAVSGSIAFVGLVVPHLLRPFVGNDPEKLLPASTLGGAILLLWADLAVRLLSSATELKIGVLTSVIGAPFFLILILKMRKRMT